MQKKNTLQKYAKKFLKSGVIFMDMRPFAGIVRVAI